MFFGFPFKTKNDFEYWVIGFLIVLLLPMFTSFYLDRFLLVYFIILSQYPHTWLFYTGCISEHAIAAKGCVSSFSSFFSYITEATNWSSLCCWHTGVLFYALSPLILCSHALHYAGSGRFCFSRSCFHLLISMLHVLIRSRAHWWILHHISVLLSHQAGSVRFIR